jgi:hypothetical protein
MLDGSNKIPMESLAVAVATQTINPLLTMDTKVYHPSFSIKITLISYKNLQFRTKITKRIQITLSEN